MNCGLGSAFPRLSIAGALGAVAAVTLGLRLLLQLSATWAPVWGRHVLWLVAMEWVCFGLASVALVWMARERLTWRWLSPGGHGWRSWAEGLLLGVACHPVADFVRASTESIWPSPEADRVAQAELLQSSNALEMATLLLAIGIFGPLAEEFFYRGALWRRLEVGRSATWCLLWTSLGFALGHASPRDWPALTLVATLLGLARLGTRTLVAPAVAHAAFNSVTIVGYWLELARPGHLELWTGVDWLLAAFSAGGCALLWLWLRRQGEASE